SARGNDLPVRSQEQQLVVVAKSVADRLQIIRHAAMSARRIAASDALYVLGYLIRAREYTQIVAAVLRPHIELSPRLRAAAPKLLGRRRFERALVREVGNPGRADRRQQRGENGQHQDLDANAVGAQDAETARDGGGFQLAQALLVAGEPDLRYRRRRTWKR